jgi:hypothetical protein
MEQELEHDQRGDDPMEPDLAGGIAFGRGHALSFRSNTGPSLGPAPACGKRSAQWRAGKADQFLKVIGSEKL